MGGERDSVVREYLEKASIEEQTKVEWFETSSRAEEGMFTVHGLGDDIAYLSRGGTSYDNAFVSRSEGDSRLA